MNTDTSFTLEELLEALQGAQVTAGTGDAVRMEQLVEATGLSRPTLSTQLRRLKEAGRVECVKVPYERIDGAWVRVIAYRVRHE